MDFASGELDDVEVVAPVYIAAEVGFVHFSTREQLPRVAAFLYGGPGAPDDLVVLVVDPALLDVPVKYEPMPPDGEEFPHVYGPVPVGAVVDVETWG